MANYATLISAIQQVIKTNGNNEITGALLQQSLLAMINSLGGYYQFAGIATPSTNPGTPDQNVFYIGGAGTYPNFSNLEIPTGHIGVLKYNGTWTLETVQAGDANAVQFVEQTLTNTQKVQARTNIDAASNEQVSQLRQEVDSLIVTVFEDGFFIIDSDRNIGFYVDEDGIAPLIMSVLSTLFTTTTEDGFYIIDSDRNIGFMVNTSGAHSANLVEY